MLVVLGFWSLFLRFDLHSLCLCLLFVCFSLHCLCLSLDPPTYFLHACWLSIISWIIGSTLFYRDVLREEQMSIQKFGDDHKRYIKRYMEKVPRMNLIAGVFRLAQRRK